MKSFLSEIEKHKHLFLKTNNEIIQWFLFRNDIYYAFNHFLKEGNPRYEQNCLDNNHDIYEQNRVYIDTDNSNHCYLKVLGNDNHTVLIIRSDDSNYEDYKNISGKKITESEFVQYLDLSQRAYISELQLSPRFLKDVPDEIDICEEMTIPFLFDYFEYLNKTWSSLILFDEPENTGTKYYRMGYGTPNRKNEIIDFDQRYNELMKYNPYDFGRIEGMQTGVQYTYYLYDKEGFILAIIEPVLGRGYQYALNLGNIDKYDTMLINSMIQAAMEANEKTAMQDPAIMRKNHTTFDKFQENLSIFLNSEYKNVKFYYDVNKAKDVYR